MRSTHHASLASSGSLRALPVRRRPTSEIGVAHSGVIDETNPIPYSTVVFRDPDDIQLEFIYVEM